ncbi:MAG: hypothetical protein KDH15_09900 [Rhodocyclaceae bacterium]|nr:hypothetical protein [Rhodocyclaceae bacterium]
MPHPNRIFHYTSVENLALILNSGKIRFSRLDKVDDASEAPMAQGIAFSKYFFVSCWTAEPVESIPQWHLYTNGMQGVRIDLPAYPFQSKRVTAPKVWQSLQIDGSIYSPLDLHESFGPTYTVVPTFMSRDQFAGYVEYVPNVQERYDASVRTQSEDPSKPRFSISKPYELVRLKTLPWLFQKEYRFALFVLPTGPLPADGPGNPDYYQNVAEYVADSFGTGRDPGVEYIDLDLRQGALSELVVTTGPLCSVGAKLCVEALVQRYAPTGRVQSSELEGCVRKR